jgi:hypothetical protein
VLINWLPRQRLYEADKDTSGTAQSAEAATSPDVEQVSTDDDFDKDRAMATIQKLRSFEREAKQKLARLAELEQQAAARDEQELSAAQKAEKRAKELEDKFNQAQQLLRKATLKDAARAAADELNLPFATSALDDALALGVFDALEIGDDGKVKGINQALKDLRTARPYLFTQPKTPELDAAHRGGTTKEKEADAKTRQNATRWGIRLPHTE